MFVFYSTDCQNLPEYTGIEFCVGALNLLITIIKIDVFLIGKAKVGINISVIELIGFTTNYGNIKNHRSLVYKTNIIN